MVHQTSPGVDRALAAAREAAERCGSKTIRLVHYMMGLMHEPDSKPLAILERMGYGRDDILHRLAEQEELIHAVPESKLLDLAREWSLARRADPTLMTDALLMAVLKADPDLWFGLEPFDVLAEEVERLVGSEPSPMAGPDEPPVSFDLPDEPDLDLGAARALDANFNRSREALRVLEDYFRFVLNDAFLTNEIKAARHDLAKASKRLPQRLLIVGRDTLGDVGTTATAAGEYDRSTPHDVARVNLKRLQESLRSLEEFGKLQGSELARGLEAIRYRTYTVERALAIGSESRDRLKSARLYMLLTASQCVAPLDQVIEQAAAGGVNVFQLREKDLTDRELLEQARNVRRWTRREHALFIVNDRPDIARLAEADGVHLGQDDLSVRDARRVLGPEPLVGVSTHSIGQIHQAIRDGADYLGIGPTFPSKTKTFEAFPGLDFIREATAETSLPAFALGGIDPSNVQQVIAAGARRIAVSSCLARAADPEPVARVLRLALDSSPLV
jgi:thiamine-phosphate pyrophosphorylase